MIFPKQQAKRCLITVNDSRREKKKCFEHTTMLEKEPCTVVRIALMVIAEGVHYALLMQANRFILPV